MSKVKLNNGPYTVASTAPENEYYKYEGNCEQFGPSASARTSGFWDVDDKGSDNSALGAGYDIMLKVNSKRQLTDYAEQQQLTDFIRLETRFLYDYVTAKNIYNLKVVKEILEGMLQEVNEELTRTSIKEKLNNERK